MQKKKINESIEDMMPASPDEKSMAMRQAKFIEYVAEEIEEYLENNRAFPEWMQNKLSAFHQKAKDIHAVMAGDYDDEDDEDMNEDVKKKMLKMSNVNTADKRPEKYVKPDGRTGIRMVPAKRDVIKTERVKKLDELSPNLLHRYVKKATGSVAGTAAGMGADASKGKVDPKKARTLNKRMSGIAGASGRMSDKANQNESYINEKLSVNDGMAAWIDDFKKSAAPQFKGKSDKERRDMAIAAFLDAKKGPQNEKFVSAAQRKAVWATKADGGKGHPDNRSKKK